MKNLVVIGTSGHSRVIIDVLEKMADVNLVGLLDDFRTVGMCVDGYRVLGGVVDLPSLIKTHGIDSVAIAVGDNWQRRSLVNKIAEVAGKAVTFPTIVHSRACVARNANLEEGCVVLANAVVNSGTILQRHCLVNTAATLDHDGVMKEFSSLAPGVHAGGNVIVGRLSAVCIGATIIHKVVIGENAVVGAGALVVKDVPDNSLVYGVPASVIRSRRLGETYL